MVEKRIRNPRIFVDTPSELKRAYTAACEANDTTVSEDLRRHMKAVVKIKRIAAEREA